MNYHSSWIGSFQWRKILNEFFPPYIAAIIVAIDSEDEPTSVELLLCAVIKGQVSHPPQSTFPYFPLSAAVFPAQMKEDHPKRKSQAP